MNIFSAIFICCFLNSFCLFFACIIFLNINYNYFFLFCFNSCYWYFTISFCLLLGNILIFDRFNQLIQVFFATLGRSLKAYIFYLLYKNTLIFYNNISIYYVKFWILLFYTKFFFFIEQTIYIFS